MAERCLSWHSIMIRWPAIQRGHVPMLFLAFPESEGECPSHLVVLCRGRIFTFDAVHDGHILSPPEISRYIYD